MTLLKTINTEIQQNEILAESYGLNNFFNADGKIITENLDSFISGSISLINSLYIQDKSKVHSEVDTLKMTEIETFSNILAGLEYFRRKNVGAQERNTLTDILDDDDVTTYVKQIGAEKAEDIVDEIKAYFYKGYILKRSELDKMLADIKHFYLSKKANVGPILNVSSLAD